MKHGLSGPWFLRAMILGAKVHRAVLFPALWFELHFSLSSMDAWPHT
jgi:hypothetical protein